jgi:SAM-dependent methyltransferase
VFDIQDYGRQFASIYDDLIPRDSFTDAMAEWILSQVKAANPDVLELGVGTGRVLIPLTRLLAKHGATGVAWGVDSSPEMLAQLARMAGDTRVIAHQADIRTFRTDQRFDLVLCVCNTIGMSVEPGGESAVLATAGSLLRPGGTLIVESQNPDTVRMLFGKEGPGSYFLPYEGDRRGLVSFGRIQDCVLRVDQIWLDGDEAVHRSESVHLAESGELIAWAAEAGLELVAHHAGLEGQPPSTRGVHDVLVFRAP